MKISRLLAVVLTLGFMAGPAVAGLVTNGLIAAHDAGLGWDGTNLSDGVIGDGYDATGTLAEVTAGNITHTPAAGSDPAFFSFTHKDDHIALDAIPTVLGTSDFTVQMWVNIETSSDTWAGAGLLANAGATGDNFGFALGQLRGNQGSDFWGWTLHDTRGIGTVDPWDGWQSTNSVAQGSSFTDGTWKLITVTRSAPETEYGGESGIKIWLNDGSEITQVQDNSSNYGFAAVTTDMGLATMPLDINGGYTVSGVRHGRMKSGDKFNKLLVYNRRLTGQEIIDNYNAGPSAVVPEPASLTLLGIGAALVLLRRRRA
jgi:hypothetical protein